jgi:hypothetical protein
MDFIKEITRRLVLFATLLVGSLGMGQMIELVLVKNGFPELYGELINMLSFVFLLIFCIREIKFEEIK